MRYLVTVGLGLGLAVASFGQGRQSPYWSLGGFGNVVYPGTGHAPNAPAVSGTGQRIPGTMTGRGGLAGPIPITHQQHRRSVIVPYPVYYGGFGFDNGYGYPSGYQGGYDQGNPIVNTNSAPSVVINQTFVPQQAYPQVREYSDNQDQAQSSMHMYQAPPTHPYADASERSAPAPQAVADDKPTLYLIAFKNHNIVQALGYWMEGPTLHYVSVEHTLNQASLDLIDRDLSLQLNSERGIEFKLPPAK